ncbi:MAG: hypothetical protein GX542_04680 [Rhodococcus sp.]|nr:hypothetical protein [Rhodococcus sp. (in: high G+C Gram-positive bacteria)]
MAVEHDYSASLFEPVSVRPSLSTPRFDDVVGRAVGMGSVSVGLGAQHEHPEALFSTRWVDVAGDGRYVIGPKDFENVVSGDAKGFVTRVEAMIRVAVKQARDLDES